MLAIVLGLWVPLGLGCLITGPGGGGTDVPPVDDDGCSEDHADYWEPDPAGAEIAQGAEGVDCNEMIYFSGGGAQGGATFHIEPTLRVTNPDLQPGPAPSITWTLTGMDGEQLAEQGIEVYEEDIQEEPGGFSVTSRVFIGAGLRGKNILVSATMDGLEPDTTAGEPDAGTGEEVVVNPQTAVYITP